MESEDTSVHGFQNPQYTCDLGSLVDTTGHLNELNCRFQGIDQPTHNLCDSIIGFQTKLALLRRQLKANYYSQFQTLAEVNVSRASNSEKWAKSNDIRLCLF
jgi:hypothetical protein